MIQTIAWLILAAIHAMPAMALFRPAALEALYRVEPENPLFLLMQHRAALFLAVFVGCLMAAFLPECRKLAAVITTISMVSFMLLYWRTGSPKALQKIARVDLIGLPILVYATAAAFCFLPV